MPKRDDWRRPGFSIPGNAAAAGRKGHRLGVAHQWTADEAREHARRGGLARQEQLRAARDEGEAMSA